MTASPAIGGSVKERIASVRRRIASACERTGRAPESVTLIAVSKTHPVEAVMEAWRAGITDFGENRVQEALPKIEATLEARVKPTWHLIGHLQSNKAKAAARPFAILHGVDSERALRALSAATFHPVRVMFEVNVAAEESKFGVSPSQVGQLMDSARALPNIVVEGLMTVAPHVDDPEHVRPVFRALRELAARHSVVSLSMGMTDDFEVAIEEGATHVRIGRAIFGERQ
jgi:pyridoxal phosphate enzyme (YggS family)